MNQKESKQLLIVVLILFIAGGLFSWLLYQSHKEELESLKMKQDENSKKDLMMSQAHEKLESDVYQLGYVVLQHNEFLNNVGNQSQTEAERNPIGYKQNSNN